MLDLILDEIINGSGKFEVMYKDERNGLMKVKSIHYMNNKWYLKDTIVKNGTVEIYNESNKENIVGNFAPIKKTKVLSFIRDYLKDSINDISRREEEILFMEKLMEKIKYINMRLNHQSVFSLINILEILINNGSIALKSVKNKDNLTIDLISLCFIDGQWRLDVVCPENYSFKIGDCKCEENGHGDIESRFLNRIEGLLTIKKILERDDIEINDDQRKVEIEYIDFLIKDFNDENMINY